MRYRVFDDPFINRQPPLAFLDELNGPVHQSVPPSSIRRITLVTDFPDPEGLLDTAYADFRDFLRCAGAETSTDAPYRILCKHAPTAVFEAYTVTFSPDCCEIAANDTEGIRRGLVYVEDTFIKNGGTLPTSGTVHRKPWLRSRISRCVFSPINRHLPDSEELADDVEYYSDNYLLRLAHDGVNGIWISTAFRFMLPSKIIPEYGFQSEKSIAKLNRTIAKCRRYGIGVYLLANEPASYYMNAALKNHPEVQGVVDGKPNGFICMSRPQGLAYAEECGRTLFTLAPGLRGLIVISAGESLSSCASEWHFTCELCKAAGLTHGTAFAKCEEALRRGIASVKPEAEFISWSYDHRSWDIADIRDACRSRGDGIIHMQNFEDCGFHMQLGKPRLALDYWLSFIGPGEVFRESVKINRECGHETYAKLQVSNSHETASVPYLPVPGILYEKFRIMKEFGVTGAQYSWYFGSYPSLMTKAAGELAFTDTLDDRKGFLRELARLYWREDAAEIAEAWEQFSEAYQNVPTALSFEWYGPLNDAVTWKLFLKPVDLPLARGWQALEMNGDRFGECLTESFTYDEACELLLRLTEGWRAGLASLPKASDETQRAQLRTAHALGLMFESAYDAAEFYRLRNELGLSHGDTAKTLDRMQDIVTREIALSGELAQICEREPGLGYHSEALAYKFFPEKLRWRMEELRETLETDFPEVRARIERGEQPLPFYYGADEGSHVYTVGGDINTARWETFTYADGTKDKDTAVRFAYDGTDFVVQLRIPKGTTVTLWGEYEFFRPSVPVLVTREGASVKWPGSYGLWGERAEQANARYRHTYADDIVTLRMNREAFGIKSGDPFRLMLTREGERPSNWVRPDRMFNRLIFGNFSPDTYGFLLTPSTGPANG